MRSSRVVLAGMLALLIATGGACAKPGTNTAPIAEASPSPSPSPSPPDPMVVLTGAITKTHATTLTFTIDADLGGAAVMHGTGALDSANRRQSSTMTVTADGKTTHAAAVVIGTDVYLKLDPPPPGVSRKKWLHLNIAKLHGLSIGDFGDLSDPTGLESYAKAAATVRRTGPGQYEGTLDFTKLAAGEMAWATMVGGEYMKAVPFTATTDEQDQLTSFVIKMPSMAGVPATTVTARFSDFGAPVSIQAPPKSQTQEAPKSLR